MKQTDGTDVKCVLKNPQESTALCACPLWHGVSGLKAYLLSLRRREETAVSTHCLSPNTLSCLCLS